MNAAAKLKDDRAADPYWMQRLGGQARAKQLSKKRLSESGRKAGIASGRARRKKARRKPRKK